MQDVIVLEYIGPTVCCRIRVPKVADQKWRTLQLHFGENCKPVIQGLKAAL